MRRFTQWMVIAGFIANGLAGSGLAQPGDGGRFPRVGGKLPDIRVFDQEGRPFSTAAIRGRYAVIVFGCLT